ncbi:F0F1 ATP synthase, subunit delta [Sulfurimonas gotlandica GD1]|uniref:F0F1 ATP synthase, subunit delta n=1 Tax=Sulfurimonas gotlandica (strain DSM 19862 / JCM 16533 / GD1) TaxID=929558 RepID=B6BMT8_SULGG|nr:F0F1 ATP synthase subunit delta [Sulfurimonas gotlandica]EDZ61495.1 ATP synthase F1, delta subunit [Sulfurimonas gotlandica GD1]EHP30792.1 F0F1 ATP synthase, subunit delta [Sulfurimonas gotlandica GD1]
MEELIAKRYIKALKQGSDAQTMQNMTVVFSALAQSFKDAKFIQIIDNPNVTKEEKLEIILAAVKPAKSETIDSLVKILVEKKRLFIIPALAEAMRKDMVNTSKTYSGVVYSDSDIDAKVIEDLSSGLSKKFDSNISLEFIKDNFNGIKVDVEDLGIEINFSKTRINNQIIEHIVKAI